MTDLVFVLRYPLLCFVPMYKISSPICLYFIYIPNQVNQLKYNFLHSTANNKAPNYLSQQFESVRNCHSIGTTISKMSFQVSAFKSYGKSSFRYTGVLLWNELPEHIQVTVWKPLFKCQLKQFLFRRLVRQELDDFIYY